MKKLRADRSKCISVLLSICYNAPFFTGSLQNQCKNENLGYYMWSRIVLKFWLKDIREINISDIHKMIHIEWNPEVPQFSYL